MTSYLYVLNRSLIFPPTHSFLSVFPISVNGTITIQLGNIIDTFLPFCHSSDLIHHQVLSFLLSKTTFTFVQIAPPPTLFSKQPHPLLYCICFWTHMCTSALASLSIVHAVGREIVLKCVPILFISKLSEGFALLLRLCLNSLKSDSYLLALSHTTYSSSFPIFPILGVVGFVIGPWHMLLSLPSIFSPSLLPS